MPNYKTSVATAQDAAIGNNANFASRPDARNIDGKLCHARVQYTLLGTEAANETIKLCHLPKGARVIPFLSGVTPSADPGTTLTLDVGTLGDDNAFADTLVLSAGAITRFDAGTPPAASLGDTAVGEGSLLSSSRDDQTDNAVYAKVHAAASLNAGVKLNFDIVFAIP